MVQNCLGCFVLVSLALRMALTMCAQLRKPGRGNLYLRIMQLLQPRFAAMTCEPHLRGARGSDQLDLIDLHYTSQQALTCKNLLQR
jgi:hypothetical protein